MRNILIVDDDELVRALCSNVLQDAGYLTSEAEHGGQALGKLATQRFDLALVDLLMPVREGIETILEMRRRWPDLRVIAMSGGATRLGVSGLLNLAGGLGAHQTLAKPLTPDLLLAMVNQQLNAAPG